MRCGLRTNAAAGAAAGESWPVPPVPYVMGMGDLMNTLIQPRHTKLGLAGRAENWAVANYALSELRQVFERIGKAMPHFRGMPVPDLIDAALTAPLGAVEAAVRKKTRKNSPPPTIGSPRAATPATSSRPPLRGHQDHPTRPRSRTRNLARSNRHMCAFAGATGLMHINAAPRRLRYGRPTRP